MDCRNRNSSKKFRASLIVKIEATHFNYIIKELIILYIEHSLVREVEFILLRNYLLRQI